METIYDVTYFINKFEAIPENRMCVGLMESVGPGLFNYCSIGWCRKYYPETRSMPDTDESKALGWLIGIHFGVEKVEDFQYYVTRINDGTMPQYRQPTPKQRILSCLYDIYEKTYGRKYQAEPEPKERIVYVMVDSTVKELSGQLTNN